MDHRQLRLRSVRSLSRRAPHRDTYKRILVVCEGEVTEVQYFRYWGRYLRMAAIQIEIANQHGVPKSLVEIATRMMREAAREAHRQRDDSSYYDEVWCVFDTDEHPNIAAAVDQAAANSIGIAVSNPSFELWALLHFQDQTAYLSRQSARTKLRVHIPGYEKLLPADAMMAHYDDARFRAVSLGKSHEQCGSPPTSNPSTTVWELVEAIRAAAARSK